MSNKIAVRLYSRPDPSEYAEGGLTQMAEATRQGGRGDDDILLHLSPEEFEWLKSQWGEPLINPHTGLPEYSWLSKTFKKVTKAVKDIAKSPLFQAVAPIALNFIAPGLGGAIGSALGASGSAASMVGKAVIGAGLGAAGGGSKGALQGLITGGMSGGAGNSLAKGLGLTGKLGTTVGNSILGGLSSRVGGGDFGSGALSGGLSSLLMAREGEPNALQKATPGINPMASDPNTPEISIKHTPMTPPPASILDQLKTLPGQAIDFVKEHPWQTAGLTALALSQLSSGGGGNSSKPPELPPDFTAHLPQLSFTRKRREPKSYYTYGYGPEASFYEDNSLPVYTPGAAEGGSLSRYIDHGTGASGRQDNIDARLSENEYVVDAETVALLGDGNPDAGAKKLDHMRQAIRKQKGKSLTKGKFTEAAKSPLDYLGGR